MNDPQPSNDVLAERLDTLLKNQEREIRKSTETREKIYGKLTSIEIQTTKTNGRVSRNEKDITALKKKSESTTLLKGKLSTILWLAGILTTALITYGLGKL